MLKIYQTRAATAVSAGVPESGQTLTTWAGRAYHARATLKTRIWGVEIFSMPLGARVCYPVA